MLEQQSELKFEIFCSFVLKYTSSASVALLITSGLNLKSKLFVRLKMLHLLENI